MTPALPPAGFRRVAITEARPAGCPPLGSIWYVDTATGAATTVYQDEAQALEAAWALHDRLARMLMAARGRIVQLELFEVAAGRPRGRKVGV